MINRRRRVWTTAAMAAAMAAATAAARKKRWRRALARSRNVAVQTRSRGGDDDRRQCGARAQSLIMRPHDSEAAALLIAGQKAPLIAFAAAQRKHSLDVVTGAWPRKHAVDDKRQQQQTFFFVVRLLALSALISLSPAVAVAAALVAACKRRPDESGAFYLERGLARLRVLNAGRRSPPPRAYQRQWRRRVRASIRLPPSLLSRRTNRVDSLQKPYRIRSTRRAQSRSPFVDDAKSSRPIRMRYVSFIEGKKAIWQEIKILRMRLGERRRRCASLEAAAAAAAAERSSKAARPVAT